MERVRALSERSELRSTHRIREAQGTRRAGGPGHLFAYFLATQKVKARERTSFKVSASASSENNLK